MCFSFLLLVPLLWNSPKKLIRHKFQTVSLFNGCQLLYVIFRFMHFSLSNVIVSLFLLDYVPTAHSQCFAPFSIDFAAGIVFNWMPSNPKTCCKWLRPKMYDFTVSAVNFCDPSAHKWTPVLVLLVRARSFPPYKIRNIYCTSSIHSCICSKCHWPKLLNVVLEKF